ncbi:MAG: hypothetical protein OXB88_08135 [Bacteriovoracales bacterium]|nr:hypothetical protein [Bacteriovoracales bacterium]
MKDLNFSNRISNKFLTLLFISLAFISSSAFSSILLEQKFKTHLRWNLHIDKKDAFITKTGSGFYIETFAFPLYKKLKKELSRVNRVGDYFEKITFHKGIFPKKPARIRVDLKGKEVELLSFYQSRDKKYVLDFWKNNDDKENDKAISPPLKAKTQDQAIRQGRSESQKTVKKEVKDKSFALGGKVKYDGLLRKKNKITPKETLESYRGFNYGAALIWDYPSLSPKIEKKIDMRRKTPEYFYPIKDRNLEGRMKDKEAHIQLNINLYRKEKYGLMSKSIQLYRKKYRLDENYDLNEFLKSLALIKENLRNPEGGPFRSAMVVLDSIANRTNDYDLKKSIHLYHIQYLIEQKNMIEALKIGKKLYVESKARLDQETLNYAAEVIFYSLSHLGQIKKIRKFSSERSVKKLVSPQTVLAYKIYVLHKENRLDEVISLFEKNKRNIQKPIDSSILYNVAEAFFRKAKYKKAIGVYQDFLKNYSYMGESSFARVRLALSHEILNSDIDKALKLYEYAINRSSHPKARYEAKLRYVAMRNTRKINPNDKDKSVLTFLEYRDDEKKNIDSNLKELLWSVRLRIFLNSGQYQKALSYITVLPINTLRSSVKKMFYGDGAEIIYGIISNAFNQGDTARVVKLWEIYRDLYENKVAQSAYLNFIVAKSYISLGIEGGVKRIIKNLKKMGKDQERSFPIWISRKDYGGVDNLVDEINIFRMVQESNWNDLVKSIDKMKISNNRKLFYEVIALYHSKYFKQAVSIGEEFLRKTPSSLPLSKRETADFFEAYLESLYNISPLVKFRKSAKAFIQDIEVSESSNSDIMNLSEKIRYLLIESLSSSQKSEDLLEVEASAKRFLAEFKKSIYGDRVRFLLASNFINHKKIENGIKILNELIANENTLSYIKEMSKSEITSIKLNEKIVN